MVNKHDFLFLLHNLDKEAGYDDYYSYYGGSDNEYDDEKLTPNEDWSILNCAKRQRVHQVASIIELIRSNPAYNVNCNAEFKRTVGRTRSLVVGLSVIKPVRPDPGFLNPTRPRLT
ncbi:hypothetical protein DY000_02048335 [Brassica cretica]|uniref:Uncharacterized protein n=2 Tax=Brassica cretica TaxID=69181 RepID=A0ABQ7F6F9_BRACR|nr:hypothetical protein DY000_02048335 [Brassica cretica]